MTAIVDGFAKADPGVKVTVFRATTGQLNARIAADQHSGGLRADVIWGTDPLSMESYAQQHLFLPWPLPDLAGVPAADQTAYFWGTRELYLVLVARKGLTPMPTTWSDLTSAAYKNQVALPDPAAAGSAFAALGYFATAPGFGMSFYRALKANGAVQVSTIPEVVTDVAEGRYQLGITLYSEVRSAIAAGSPVVLDWPADAPSRCTARSRKRSPPPARQAPPPAPCCATCCPRSARPRSARPAGSRCCPASPARPRPAGRPRAYPGWPALFGAPAADPRQYQAIFGA